MFTTMPSLFAIQLLETYFLSVDVFNDIIQIALIPDNRASLYEKSDTECSSQDQQYGWTCPGSK